MGISPALLLLTSYCLMIVQNASSAPGNIDTHRMTRMRSLGKFVPRNHLKNDNFNEFFDDDDLFDLTKRQPQSNSDDYGHMRFGKRGEDMFDDYGHLRFGRSD